VIQCCRWRTHFTVHRYTRTPGFSVSTSRILATDFNTLIISVSHMKSSFHRQALKSHHFSKPKWRSKLLYDWRFTAKQFVLASSPSRLTNRGLFSTEPFGQSPYVNSFLTRRWVCLLWICLAFVKSTYRTYSVLLPIPPSALYTSPLSVQALQTRSCLSYVSYATTAA
jgi:hypothetical protein